MSLLAQQIHVDHENRTRVTTQTYVSGEADRVAPEFDIRSAQLTSSNHSIERARQDTTSLFSFGSGSSQSVLFQFDVDMADASQIVSASGVLENPRGDRIAFQNHVVENFYKVLSPVSLELVEGALRYQFNSVTGIYTTWFSTEADLPEYEIQAALQDAGESAEDFEVFHRQHLRMQVVVAFNDLVAGDWKVSQISAKDRAGNITELEVGEDEYKRTRGVLAVRIDNIAHLDQQAPEIDFKSSNFSFEDRGDHFVLAADIQVAGEASDRYRAFELSFSRSEDGGKSIFLLKRGSFRDSIEQIENGLYRVSWVIAKSRLKAGNYFLSSASVSDGMGKMNHSEFSQYVDSPFRFQILANDSYDNSAPLVVPGSYSLEFEEVSEEEVEARLSLNILAAQENEGFRLEHVIVTGPQGVELRMSGLRDMSVESLEDGSSRVILKRVFRYGDLPGGAYTLSSVRLRDNYEFSVGEFSGEMGEVSYVRAPSSKMANYSIDEDLISSEYPSALWDSPVKAPRPPEVKSLSPTELELSPENTRFYLESIDDDFQFVVEVDFNSSIYWDSMNLSVDLEGPDGQVITHSNSQRTPAGIVENESVARWVYRLSKAAAPSGTYRVKAIRLQARIGELDYRAREFSFDHAGVLAYRDQFSISVEGGEK